MSSSIVEVIRSLHQDNELQVQKIISDLVTVTKTRKNQILRNTRVKQRLDVILSNQKRLDEFYTDEDAVLRSHLESMNMSSAQQFSSFVDKIMQIKDSFSHFPNRISYHVDGSSDELPVDEIDKMQVSSLFLQSEYLGKVVDVAAFFSRFKNLAIFKGFRDTYKLDKFDYITFLQNFDDVLYLFGFQRKAELTSVQSKEYLDYLNDFVVYMSMYVAKLHPTVPLTELHDEIERSFEGLVATEQQPGYFPIDIEEFEERDAKQYGLTFTLERKEEEIAYNMAHNVKKQKTPASIADIVCIPCEKAFTKEGIYHSHLTGKRHMKSVEAISRTSSSINDNDNHDSKSTLPPLPPPPPSSSSSSATTNNHNNANNNARTNELLAIALLEYKLMHFTDLVRDLVDYSIIVADKIYTVGTIDLEESEEEDTSSHKTIASVSTLHNPKNVPLGWDGKPIPLWMYKLHGLNIDYPCEICGGDVHKGDRNFIKHFREWKHTYMLKCLGIQNSQHFVNVPTIKEAQALHERLQAEVTMREFSVQREEEMEDAMGNVYSREEYEDHKRHGLIF